MTPLGCGTFCGENFQVLAWLIGLSMQTYFCAMSAESNDDNSEPPLTRPAPCAAVLRLISPTTCLATCAASNVSTPLSVPQACAALEGVTVYPPEPKLVRE